MTDGPDRRQLLKTVAASSIAAPIAGCVGTLETDDEETTNSTSDDGSGSESVVVETACDVAEVIITSLSSGNFETAASYYPHEYTDETEKAHIVEEFEDGRGSALGWMNGTIEDISCACSEAVSTVAHIDDLFTGEVTEAREVRHAVTYDTGEGTTTDSVFVNAFEIDGDWYGRFSAYDGSDLCGTDAGEADGRGSDDDSAREQPLEPARWEAVDEIVLRGRTAGWIGAEPEPIEDVENPTLFLVKGREYTIRWEDGDGTVHNIQVRDEDENAIAETELTDKPAESDALTVEATAAMDSYVCEPHKSTMAGAIELVTE